MRRISDSYKGNNMKDTLEKSLKKKWVIRLITKNPGSEAYNGIVMSYSRSIIAFKEYSEFRPDGILFFPRRAIARIRDNGFEECENKLIRMTGDIKAAKKQKWISNINNLNELFSYCFKKHIWPAIEIVQENISSIYIGPITKVTASSIRIYSYDATGAWEDEYIIKNKDVLRVEILSHYVNSFNKYMMAYNKPQHPAAPVQGK